jgi:hypothetical protein
MHDPSTARTASTTPLRVVRRGIVLLVVSLLLHVVIVNWATGTFGVPFLQVRQQRAIVVELHNPPVIVPTITAAPKPEAVPETLPKVLPTAAAIKPPHKPSFPRKRPSAPTPALAPPEQTAPEQMAAVQPEPATPTETVDTDPAQAQTEAPATSAPSPATGNPDANTIKPAGQTAYRYDAPPSAELKYDVKALREGQTVYGNGTIKWMSDGGNYSVHGEAGVLFFTLLSFDSTGQIDNGGVGPVLYAEKRFRRSETNTHFQRARNTISFSSSTVTYPRKGGEQDRASVVWQVAALARGDSGKIVPGAELEFFVAGVRDGEPWRMRVVGSEEIDIGGARQNAWHVVRLPRPGSYDQKIDIWFAPQKEWYPVKIRYTETNGEYLDMTLSAVHPVESR